MRWRILSTLLLMMAGVALAAHASSSLALITDVHGHVIHSRGGAWSEALIFSPVQSGERFQVAVGGELVLSFHSGRRTYIKGPVAITVHPGGVTRAPLPHLASRAFRRLRRTVRRRFHLLRPRLVVLRGIRFTNFSTVETLKPLLKWVSDVPLKGGELTVATASGDQAVVQQQVSGQERSYQVPQPLAYGSEYRVILNATTASGTAERKIKPVYIPTKQALSLVDRRRAQAFKEFAADPGDVSPLAELLGTYVEEKMDNSDGALTLIDKILSVRKDPEYSKDLYLRKIKILTDNGEPDEAQKVYDQYEKALDQDADS